MLSIKDEHLVTKTFDMETSAMSMATNDKQEQISKGHILMQTNEEDLNQINTVTRSEYVLNRFDEAVFVLLHEDTNTNFPCCPSFNVKKRNFVKTEASSSLNLNSDSLSFIWKDFWKDCETIKNAKLCKMNPITLHSNQTVSIVKNVSDALRQQSTDMVCHDQMTLSKIKFCEALNNYVIENLITVLQTIDESLKECTRGLINQNVKFINIAPHGEDVIFLKVLKVITKLLNKLYQIYDKIESIVTLAKKTQNFKNQM
ncbi:hypothetical protein FQR65_LT00028 [Abscondita terminalis]|nr:hypothetical protein FQR65_LT00028 [Abscondita terminalis]